MDQIDNLLSIAERVIKKPTKYWQSAPEEARAAVIMLLHVRGLSTNKYVVVRGRKKDAAFRDWRTALKVLVRSELQSELNTNMTSHHAESISDRIQNTLKWFKTRHPELTHENVIAEVTIRDKYDAHLVISTLRNLCAQKNRTPLELGLLKSLERWSGQKVESVISPEQLLALRTEKKLTQDEMADKLDVTPRQYSRYETGKATIPEKKRPLLENVKRMRLDTPKSPKGTHRPNAKAQPTRA